MQDEAVTAINEEVYCLACLEAPEWFINPVFKVTFLDREIYNNLVESCLLSVASGLHETISSQISPSASFFYTLPTPFEKA